MLKRFYSLTLVLLCTLMTAWASEVTVSPTLDVNFRTASGNTAWNSGYPKSAAEDGNNDFELTYAAGLFALQKYTVADLQNASKLVITLTVGSKSGVDAVKMWPFANNTWTAETGVDDIIPLVTTAVGVAPRATEGTVNTPAISGKKVSGSDPAQATFTISGDALAAIKANATSDGTFTLLLTNNDLLNSNNKRSYLSNNTANAETSRPQLVATIETPSVVNKTTGVSYGTLAEAFAAAVTAGTDAELEVSDDQTLTGRLTWNKAATLTITPTKDITIKGHKNGMWFLNNAKKSGDNVGVLNIGGGNYTITLDGQNNEFGYDVTKYEENGTIALTNVVFQNFNLNNAGHLVGSKASEGQMILDKVTFKNCTNPADAYIYKARVTNDRVVLKGYLNIDSDCPGTAIYAASETKTSGTTGRIKIDDDEFTASNTITIEWPGTKAEGIVVVIGSKAANASKFKLTDTDWRLERKSSNGDLIMKPAKSDLGPWLDFVQGSYTHPGLLHTSADIDAVKARLTANEALATAAYSRLETQSGGTAAGAVEYLKRMDKKWESTYSDYANFSRAVTDAKLAYNLALRYQLKNSTASADAAVKILNDWAKNCKGILRIDDGSYVNNVPDPNEYLITIQAYQFANAAELLRDYSGWQADDFTAFKTWMRNTFGELAYRFLNNHHGQSNKLHYWLNWDLACLNAMLSVGILCDDKAMVDYALAYPTSGEGTGNVNNAIVATHQDPDSDETLAQCQESGRDQGHATLDVTLLGVLCLTTQNSGANIDLWTAYKALEMAEYVGKYNLKNTDGSYVYAADKVPFTTYNNGEVEHTALSEDARGTERPCWELFHAYAKKNSKADAYTEAWVKYWRAKNTYGEGESAANDELGFGSLMFGAEVSTTGIQTLQKNQSVQDGVYYNLQGQRVDNPTKGLYIVNGKKVIIK